MPVYCRGCKPSVGRMERVWESSPGCSKVEPGPGQSLVQLAHEIPEGRKRGVNLS